jgi:hypothetical protein
MSALPVKLNSVFKKCKLEVEQLYILAYVDSHGRKTKAGQTVQLRTNITTALKEVFECSDNKVSTWVNDLLGKGFLAEITLVKEEKDRLFSDMKGTRNKAVFVERKGTTKLSFFIAELIKFRKELTKKNSKILQPPGTESYGPIATAVAFFLSMYET